MFNRKQINELKSEIDQLREEIKEKDEYIALFIDKKKEHHYQIQSRANKKYYDKNKNKLKAKKLGIKPEQIQEPKPQFHDGFDELRALNKGLSNPSS